MKPAAPTPEALEPAVRVLEDAHHAWHDAANAYHKPGDFRRHVEALAQALRNVTWRLQAMKDELPGVFDEWYPPWQALLAADTALAWLNDARVDIVHRRGLLTASRCIVRMIKSYLPPDTTLLGLPPETPTANVLQKAMRRVPDEWKPHVAIEISRRWEVPKLPGRELLAVFAHCFHVLDALLLYVRELAIGSVNEDPTQFLSTVVRPECMFVDPSMVPLTFEADTGNEIRLAMEYSESSKTPGEAAKRYRLKGHRLPEAGRTLKETAEAYHEIARRIFKKDGYHVSMVYLFRSDNRAEFHLLLPTSKRDKFMMWHQLAARAAYRGFRSFIANTEVWMAQEENIPLPVPTDFEGVQGRLEGLQTYYEDDQGNAGSFLSEIIRHLGKGFLKKPVFSTVDTTEAGFASPLRAMWAIVPPPTTGGTREPSDAATHTDDDGDPETENTDDE